LSGFSHNPLIQPLCAALIAGVAAAAATAFLIIMAMAFGLIIPRMLYERLSPSSV
jgi:hypothetical protein